MSIGAAVVIPAPASGVAATGLLRSALVIDHTTPTPPGPDATRDEELAYDEAVAANMRWANGIEFEPTACTDAAVFDPCIGNGDDLDDAPNHPASREYTPFVVDAYDACSTFGWRRADYEARARQLIAARESKAVAREFWLGEKIPANPHLAATATGGPDTVTTVATAASPHNGISALVQAIADRNGGAGMIHVRPRLLQVLVLEGALRWENSQWYTATGVKVVADAGYPGTGPNGEAVTATTEWAFGTDLVEVHRGPVEVFAPALDAQSVDHVNNNEMVRAQRLYAPIWNGCVLVAASITIPATDV